MVVQNSVSQKEKIMDVSIVIPTLNAGDEIELLLKSLSTQSYPIKEIIVIDSESNDETVKICSKFPLVRVISILRKDFDHGKTRDFGVRESMSSVIIFMTQDAIPVDNELVSKLISPLKNDYIALSTARQIAKENASLQERFIREYNYSKENSYKSKNDLCSLGIKTYFCSDVCAAYKKNIYEKLGGFLYPLKTNEDMFFAAKAINNGYSIAYIGEAEVFHSHNLTFLEQFRRNYIQGYEMEKHKDLLGDVSQTNEGLKLLLYVSKRLLKRFAIYNLIVFYIDCIFRLMGNYCGRLKAKK